MASTSITPYFSSISNVENVPTVLDRATPIKDQNSPVMPPQILGINGAIRNLVELSLLRSEKTAHSSSNKPTNFFSCEDLSTALQEGSMVRLLKFRKKIRKYRSQSLLILEKADLCFSKTKEAFDKHKEEFKKLQDLETQTTTQADKCLPFPHQSNQALGRFQELASQAEKQADNNLKLADEIFKKIKETKQQLTPITKQFPRNRKAAKQAIENDNKLSKCLTDIWDEKVTNASFSLDELSICFSRFTREISKDIERANALAMQAKEMEAYVPQQIEQIKAYKDRTKAIVKKTLEAKENIQAKIKQINQKRLQHLEEKITTNSQPQSGSGSRKGNCLYFVIKAIYTVFLKVICAFLF